ncbi:hypothetical protein Pfo_022647 [Paulownia fortunei]|nr:hypothetical protein Pfo_022647 [Paulownia fortunei]
MASASSPDHHKNRGNRPKSHFNQTVCLADWWLDKTENDFQGRQLAVGGFTSREKQAMRVFSSAPILKRYDVFTIETTDGICVILKGFINKARTVENGFPSDVYNHFVFGFPPYWKEYEQKLMRKESTSKDISGFNLLKKLSPQSETVESGQPHVDSREKDLGSQVNMDVKGMRKSKKTKSSAVLLPKKSDTVIGGSEDNLSMSCIASGGLEKESYSGGPTVEDQTTLDMPVNCTKNNSSVGGNISISAVTDKVVDDSEIHDSGGIMSACHLHNKCRSKKATDNLTKVELDKRNSKESNFDRDMSSSEEILSYSEGRVRTRSMSSLKMKQKNNQTSARLSGGEKIRSNSFSSMGSEKVEFASVDCEPGGRNNWNSRVSELHGPMDKIKLSELDAGSVEDEFEQISGAPNLDKDLIKVKTKGNIEMAKNKATRSLSTLAAADNQKDNVIPDINSLSENAKASDMKTRRKLAYETPDREKEKVPSASPQCMSFNRSRSGRLLMPILEFWRNQRAIYNADRTITGIEEGIRPEQRRKGSRSTPQRKRKQPA